MSLYTRYGTDTVSLENAEPVETNPVKDLYKACERISMEAAELSGIAGWFVRAGANVSMSIKRGFETLTTFDWAPLTTLHPAQMQSVMRTVDYLELQSQFVVQPRGFSGNLHDYVMQLEPRLIQAINIRTQVIEPAIRRLGFYLSNPAERNERRDFPGGSLDTSALAKIYAAESAYFKNGNEATGAFGKLFSNNAEFIKAEFKMLEYGALLAKSPPSAVKASVEQLTIVAQGLFKSLSTATDPASKQLIQTIGNEIATVAKWVEWYSYQVTKLTEVNQVFAVLEKELS